MCFSSPDIPKPPAPPVAPRQDVEGMAAAEDERRRTMMRKGRQATVLTGGLGDPNYGKNTSGQKTLLGA